MASSVQIILVPPKGDGLKHDWKCPKAAPMLRIGDCNCGAASEERECAWAGRGHPPGAPASQPHVTKLDGELMSRRERTQHQFSRAFPEGKTDAD